VLTNCMLNLPIIYSLLVLNTFPQYLLEQDTQIFTFFIYLSRILIMLDLCVFTLVGITF
jgi:hypothetical protein